MEHHNVILRWQQQERQLIEQNELANLQRRNEAVGKE